MISDLRGSPVSPLSLHDHLPERSSPSSVRFAAQNRRALDDSGPFRRLISEKGKGQRQSPHQYRQIPERRDFDRHLLTM